MFPDSNSLKGNASDGSLDQQYISMTVPSLLARRKAKLRIMYVHFLLFDIPLRIRSASNMGRIRFAPADIQHGHTFRGLEALFSNLRISKEFITGMRHALTHSFGWQHETESDYGKIHGPTEHSPWLIIGQSAGCIAFVRASV